MKVSLVMPTINVTTELELFLKSLKVQTYRDFELIVVDQNEGDEVFEIVKNYEEEFKIKYAKSDEKGLSLNRNRGLVLMEGEIVGFPDDDCEYQPDTLEKVVTFFKRKKNYQIYSCRTLERGKNYGTGVMEKKDMDIKKDCVDTTVKSITFFVNYGKDDIILFDESLGVGATFGSGEETDYVLTLLHKGYKGRYFANDIIYHPAKKGNYSDLERAYKYALGFGALVKKEVKGRKNRFYILKYWKRQFRSFFGMIVTRNRRYHRVVMKGRKIGYTKYKI